MATDSSQYPSSNKTIEQRCPATHSPLPKGLPWILAAHGLWWGSAIFVFGRPDPLEVELGHLEEEPTALLSSVVACVSSAPVAEWSRGSRALPSGTEGRSPVRLRAYCTPPLSRPNRHPMRRRTRTPRRKITEFWITTACRINQQSRSERWDCRSPRQKKPSLLPRLRLLANRALLGARRRSSYPSLRGFNRCEWIALGHGV